LLEEVVQVREVDLGQITPNPRQPRRTVDATGLEELAASIARHGLLQPIILREAGAGYELVAGSRRLRAVQSLGHERVMALVIKDGDSETLALIENLQRADLDPIDEAEALAALKVRQGCTLEELQALVGRSVSYLSEITSLLRLPEAILGEARAHAAEGRPLPRASLVELARIKDPVTQAAAWQQLLAAGGSRAQARASARAARRSSGGSGNSPPLPNPAVLARRLTSLAEILDRTEVTGSVPHQAHTELRQALLALRTRIDRLLNEGV